MWNQAVASKIKPIYWLTEYTYGANLGWKKAEQRAKAPLWL